MTCSTSPSIIVSSNQEECSGRGMWHAWGERRGACMVFVVKPEGKRSLRKARLSWDYNITLDRRRHGLGRRGLS